MRIIHEKHVNLTANQKQMGVLERMYRAFLPMKEYVGTKESVLESWLLPRFELRPLAIAGICDSILVTDQYSNLLKTDGSYHREINTVV